MRIAAAKASTNDAALRSSRACRAAKFFQRIVLTIPVSIPAMTPPRVSPFHHKASKMTGPNEDPSPAQA